MAAISLAPYQLELIRRPVEQKIFLEGPAGSGKTTTGVFRTLALLEQGVPASQILLLVPQRTLAQPYQDALTSPGLGPGRQVSVVTVGGLARRMVELFWPLVSEDAGFARPDRPPTFLTLETSLYYMAYLVRPLFDQGLFDSVTIERSRIYSQILDNLNKAAIVGFDYTEIGQRLKDAWIDTSAQSHVFDDTQRCANLFRAYCLQNNLLDFSLQLEIFVKRLWPALLCREYLQRTYCHLVADNIEEDNPVAHDLIADWMPRFTSALLIFDQEGSFRRFLGADPDTAAPLKALCDAHCTFDRSLVVSTPLAAFGERLGQVLERPVGDVLKSQRASASTSASMMESRGEKGAPPDDHAAFIDAALALPPQIRFYPQMLDWVVAEVARLIEEGVKPNEIVILAPLLPDSLRFAIANRLEARGLPYRSHRPSRSLREEPATRAMLTLAALAHPQWNLRPARFEVAYALIQSIEGLDLVRAQLLVEAAFQPHAGTQCLLPFEQVRAETRERITYSVGTRYDRLRRWLEGVAAQPESELDYFFSRLFGEVLSQPGFGFHTHLDAGQTCANLIESAQKFRQAVAEKVPPSPGAVESEGSLGSEYVKMIAEGILAAQYIESWQIPAEEGVLVAPAYTFLLANQPVDHQFWLDVGSTLWYERLLQPLTHPMVLTRGWPRDRAWTEVEEYEYARDTLYRLALGLVRRCRKQIHLGLCQLSDSGFEQNGLLQRAINAILQQARTSP